MSAAPPDAEARSFALTTITGVLLNIVKKLLQFKPEALADARDHNLSINLHIPNIATEILLQVFSFMELKTLIASRGVCQEWRQLVPLADLHPDRRRLFDLFHDIINNDKFLESAHPQTRSFNRHAYIDQLLSQYPNIPDDFRLWILEWPSRVVIDGLWPSLPLQETQSIAFNRRYGVNWIALNPPQILTVVHSPDIHAEEYEEVIIPGLLAYRYNCITVWIMFDERPELFGKVFALYDFVDFIFAGLEKDPDGSAAIYPDWIEYISRVWKDQGPLLLSTLGRWDKNLPPKPVDMSKVSYFGKHGLRDTPTPPWIRRHEPQFQSFMKPHWKSYY